MVLSFGGFVNYDDDKLKDRNKSALMKWLIGKSGFERSSFVPIIANTKQYFENKFHRNSFSINELVKVAHVAGFNLAFITQDSETFYLLDPLYFLGDEEFGKCEKDFNTIRSGKHKEYLKMKAELEQMAAEYGFKD